MSVEGSNLRTQKYAAMIKLNLKLPKQITKNHTEHPDFVIKQREIKEETEKTPIEKVKGLFTKK